MTNSYSAINYFEIGSGIVTLCGSTKFFFDAMYINKWLTFNNWAVYQPGSWGHSFNKFDSNVDRDYSVVKMLHYHKILISDAVMVVTDCNMYIGNSTRAEIAFSTHRNIPVFYFDGAKVTGFTDKQPPNQFEDISLIKNFELINGTLGF